MPATSRQYYLGFDEVTRRALSWEAREADLVLASLVDLVLRDNVIFDDL